MEGKHVQLKTFTPSVHVLLARSEKDMESPD